MLEQITQSTTRSAGRRLCALTLPVRRLLVQRRLAALVTFVVRLGVLAACAWFGLVALRFVRRIPLLAAAGLIVLVEQVLIVRIHTDQGVYGIGETQAWRRQGSAELLPNLMHSIHDQFAPLLIGRSPFDINAIMHDLNQTLYNSLYAQAAIGDALYDLVGKFLNVPVNALLGGKCRDRVRVGAVLSMKPTEEELVEAAQDFFDRLLDLPAIEQLEQALATFAGTVLLVTHDRITALRNRDAPPPADPDRSVGQRGETPGEAASSSLDRALRRARAAEDHFRPDIATAQFRSALERSAKPELTAEDKEYGEHVAARGLVRSSVALANVSRGPAKQPYLQTAWRTAQDHPRAFRPSERIERLLEFVEAEPDRREASLAIKRFLDESSLAAEPWLFPMQFGEPVRQTVGAALDAAENGNIPPDPGQASIKPVKAPQDSARLLRRSWVRVVSPKARVIVPEERESLTPRFLIQDSKLTCLQSSNGTRLWEAAAGIDVRQAFQLPASQREAVKFSEAMLLFGEDSIQCRDVLSGEVRWSTRWPGRVRFEFAQLSESRPLVFCISDDSVAAVDPHSGAEQWQFPPRSQPASASDSGRRRTPRSNFYRDGTVGLFQSINHTDSFLLDLRTGFPLARAKANLPSDGQLKFGQSQD